MLVIWPLIIDGKTHKIMVFTVPLFHKWSWNLKITNDESGVWFRHNRKPWGLMNISTHSKKWPASTNDSKWTQPCILGSNTPGFSYS